MDAQRKRRLLAALEGQLYRWSRGGDAAHYRRRVTDLVERLHALPSDPLDEPFPRRLAVLLVQLARVQSEAALLVELLMLARIDCVLWQGRIASR